MKTLIAYASKTGTSEKCARMLAGRVPDPTFCDLCKEKPDPNAYDQVIVGGGVRMGVLHVDARQYLEGCKPILLKKRLGLFVCAGFVDKADELFKNNIDTALLGHALACECFGGEIDLGKLRALTAGDKDGAALVQGREREGGHAAPPARSHRGFRRKIRGGVRWNCRARDATATSRAGI